MLNYHLFTSSFGLKFFVFIFQIPDFTFHNSNIDIFAIQRWRVFDGIISVNMQEISFYGQIVSKLGYKFSAGG